MKKEDPRLQFVVREAYTKDVGLGIARIGFDSIRALFGLTNGIIEISGGKT